MSDPLHRASFFTLLAIVALVLSAGCNKAPVRPEELGDYNAVGVRYAPVTTPDGIAQVFAVGRAENIARKNLRQKLFANPDLVGLPREALDVTIRDEYMNAKLSELLRTEVTVIYTEYSKDERRAEAIIELDADSFRTKYLEAYNRRVALLR